MTKQQRQALEEAIADYTIARLSIKGQSTQIAKMRTQLKLDAAKRTLTLMLDSLCVDVVPQP